MFSPFSLVNTFSVLSATALATTGGSPHFDDIKGMCDKNTVLGWVDQFKPNDAERNVIIEGVGVCGTVHTYTLSRANLATRVITFFLGYALSFREWGALIKADINFFICCGFRPGWALKIVKSIR